MSEIDCAPHSDEEELEAIEVKIGSSRRPDYWLGSWHEKVSKGQDLEQSRESERIVEIV